MIIKNCSIIDCTGREPYISDVEVKDGIITKIESNLDVDDFVIDGEGKYLIPGLINLHVHINRRNVSRTKDSFRQGAPAIENSSDFHRILYAARNAWYELSQGVTTLRDLCSVGRTASALKDAITQKIIRGPRLYVCGMGIAATGGHETHRYKGAVEVDGCDDTLKAVRYEIKLGADFIKVMASGGIGGMPEHEHPAWSELSVDEIKSACDAAHSHNKKVTVHAMGALPVMNSLVAGVDGIEHGASLSDEALDIMKSRGVYYVPTASGIGAVAEKERKNGNTNLADIICEEVVFPQLESIKKAYEKGILIGAGTDTAGDMCEELLLLEKAGLSRYEALQCATFNASKIVENNMIGTIQCGKIADLVLLDNNPLDDLHNIRKVNTVVFEGEVVNEQWMCNLQ